MYKDFKKWSTQKEKLEKFEKNIIFKKGEIWWCTLGMNLQQESCGKGINYQRPVLILTKLSAKLCLVIPATTKSKTGSWFYNLNIYNKPASLLLHQVRLISSIRLTRKLDRIPSNSLQDIRKQLIKLIH